MTVEVALSPAEFGKYDLKGKTAVIIDVLRFTTTLLAALEAGMSEFYPVRTVEEALDLKKQDPSLILQRSGSLWLCQALITATHPLPCGEEVQR